MKLKESNRSLNWNQNRNQKPEIFFFFLNENRNRKKQIQNDQLIIQNQQKKIGTVKKRYRFWF